jgi:hypothetical protein
VSLALAPTLPSKPSHGGTRTSTSGKRESISGLAEIIRMVLDDVAPIHLDLIVAGRRVWVDSDPIALDLDNIVLSVAEHPLNVEDADVVSPDE